MPALGRARGGVARRARRPGLPRRARRAAARLRRAPDAALPRRAPERARRPRGLPQARGPQPHRRAQDQQRARPGAAGQAHGQAARHRRDRRRPARRRDRDRVRAARPRVRRLHGRRGHAPPEAQRRAHGAARRRRSCPSRPARGRSRRRPRRRSATGSPTSQTRTTSSARPSARRPYPAIVRDLQRVHRRRGARAAASSARAGCPTASSPASAAAPTRSACSPPSSTTPDVELIGVEAGGRGPRHRPPRRAADRRRPRPASCTARSRAVMQDDDGQIAEAHSISRRPRLPRRRAPSTRYLRDTRPRRATSRSPTTQALEAFRDVARLEGIIPALESAHALALGAARARRDSSSTWSACRAAATRTSPRSGASRR